MKATSIPDVEFVWNQLPHKTAAKASVSHPDRTISLSSFSEEIANVASAHLKPVAWSGFYASTFEI
ncbi:hypothetical protein JM93_02891 [Roseibium hamelinense]|uniref:Uncharacterized protein n=1 Tax=Roseibium hamelinense TaxID=150831 RepID=A0A562SYB1_9HYPH|nr:hypothetical protein [Roseibium hamelinense]MTI43666.1 hypothetical protein [Roseibium hamelinense]TWI86183.1 hypothetical protein JM93_02891 [Roseibium hamelinense]